MFRPKATTPSNLRLPKQMAMPSITDVQFMLSQTMKNKGRTVEMPYMLAGQNYMITAKVDENDESHEPLWIYFCGEDTESARMLWQHATGDVNLIHNLIMQTETEAVLSGNYTAAAEVETTRRVTVSDVEPTKQTLNNIDSNVMRADRSKAILEGDLANMQIPTLLQSINMSKMTGRLVIEHKANMALIFFDDGIPVHAVSPETKGDTAITEIITWEEGEFHFVSNDKTEERTVKRRLDMVLMEGVTLLDQSRFLNEKGCKLESFLVKANPQLTEEQFHRALMTKGAPLDIDVQKRFYSAIDGRSTLLDVLRRRPMIKVEWIPIMFNMLSCGLVTLVDAPPVGGKAALLTAVPIDRGAIQSVLRQLTRSETGIFTYPAFLYFLEQEFSKCATIGVPLCLVQFEMKVRIGDALEAVPVHYVREVGKRIESIKRSFDVLGHFETFDFAMFLPNTHSKAAKIFCHRVNEILNAEQLIPGPPNQIALTFGIATAPDDTMDLGMLLSAAREAKNRAKEANQVVTLFADIELR